MSADSDVPRQPPIASGLDACLPPVRAGYLGPVNGGDPVLRCMRVLSPVPLSESYRSQLLVWRDGDVRRVLRAVDDPAAAGSGYPWDSPVLVMTGWNPGGAPRTRAQNDAAQRRLVDLVGAAGGHVRRRVVAVPEDRAWVEEHLVVEGLDLDRGIGLARRCGQEALVRWDEEHLRVVPTGDRVAASSRRWEVVDRPVLCPMQTDEIPGARCRVHGGPWTSRSIHAGSVWQEHRDLLTAFLGCGVCADGTRPVDGPGGGRGAITMSPLKIASRYGGYLW